MKDMVNHPEHYISDSGIEVIDVIEAFTSDLKGIEATDTGNIIKYICRWKRKNKLEDLKKAQWYLNHLIKKVEGDMQPKSPCNNALKHQDKMVEKIDNGLRFEFESVEDADYFYGMVFKMIVTKQRITEQEVFDIYTGQWNNDCCDCSYNDIHLYKLKDDAGVVVFLIEEKEN